LVDSAKKTKQFNAKTLGVSTKFHPVAHIR